MTAARMKAARLHAFGRPPVVEDVGTPVRPEGSTLVRVGAAAVGHLDLTVASGTFDVRPPLPHIGGTDAAGTVVASDTLPIGQRVIVRGGGVGLTRPGCWAEYVVVGDRHLILDDGALPLPTAATFLVPATTAWVAVHDVAAVRAGERVIVGGAAGAVGRVIAQLAVLAGAEVIGVVGRESSLARVPDGVRALTAEALPDRPWADAVIDTIGGEPLTRALRATVRGGRAALIGYTRSPALTLDLPNWLLSEVALLPVSMIHRAERQQQLLPTLTGLLVDGSISVPVTTFPLDRTAQACADLAAGRIDGRAAVLPVA
ncbi:quinone oxidoreductase family protein [Raineyella sp.]|uniref:quinone oxidoreductase family protein n=1 Tax=Raineyella sp. TaxID=1911550 RepID=UPI002B22188F|nr:zinc-binding dehydrogenase [Raineyella sp.]